MPEKYTEESIKAAITPQDREEMLKALEAHSDAPDFFKGSKLFQEVWVAGCYLNAEMEKLGVPEELAHNIGVVHGQYSFFKNPYKVAAMLLNDFLDGKKMDEPGEKLAERLEAQYMTVSDKGITIKYEE